MATLTPPAQSLVQGHWGGRPPTSRAPAGHKGVQACAAALSLRVRESGPWCWLAPHRVAHGEATRATQGHAGPRGLEKQGFSSSCASQVCLNSQKRGC